MTESSISFGSLVGLMVCGPDLPFTGVIRHAAVDEPERLERIWRDGDQVRMTSLDGKPRLVVGQGVSWFFPEDGDVVLAEHDAFRGARGGRGPIGGLDVGGERGSWERWDGTDFTRPTGPVTGGAFLERSVWFVELAPPEHKPYPLQLVVDAETGLVLRKTNEGFGTVTEFTEISFGGEPPADVFTWDGPVVSALAIRDERDAEHQRDMAQRAEWLRSRGLGDVTLTARGELFVHDWDDETGSFYGSVNFDAFASLLRRPVSEAPWEEAETVNAPHTYRWSDGQWEWLYAPNHPVSDAELAELKTALARTT